MDKEDVTRVQELIDSGIVRDILGRSQLTSSDVSVLIEAIKIGVENA